MAEKKDPRPQTTDPSAEGSDVEETPEADAPVEETPDEETPDEEAPDEETPDEEAPAEEAEEKPKGRRRRGAAETTTRTKKETVPAPRDAAGQVEVRARARYVRSAPRKARLVMQHIRGKQIADARAILDHTPRAASRDVLKLLNSAVANAENNYELDAEELRVSHAFVDEGPTIKRWRPRAYGRATRINKRTSHMTITLTTTSEEGK